MYFNDISWMNTYISQIFSKVKGLKSDLFSTQMPGWGEGYWSGPIRKYRKSGMICRTQRTHESSALLQGNEEIWRAKREQIPDRLCWEVTQELRGMASLQQPYREGSQRTNAHITPTPPLWFPSRTPLWLTPRETRRPKQDTAEAQMEGLQQ